MPASSKGKVLVAMSGGVDSSVAAGLLVRAGYEVIGCFMRLGSPGETLDEPIPVEACPTQHAAPGTQHSARIGHRGCCSIIDAADARAVAAELGIPLYVCNFKKDFGRIIDYFVDEYAAGRTPNPCVRCNDWLKFGKLHDYAKELGCDWVASGHYARIGTRHTAHGTRVSDPLAACRVPLAGSPHLLRGLDRSKDQSYVLFGVGPEQLASMMLPIGDMEKPRVRDLAREMGLPVSDKPDSQEICFVPDDDYAGLVERRRPELALAGSVVDEQGREVGRHAGQHRFTIGQRRGLSLSLGHAVYVVGKDAATNTVTVGPRDRLAGTGCTAAEANWLIDGWAGRQGGREGGWRGCWAKYRYNTDAVPAEARLLDDGTTQTASGRPGRFEVRFQNPQLAVAPGQAVVLYDDSASDGPDLVVGGGWIDSVTRA